MSLYLGFMRLWLTVNQSEIWVRLPSIVCAAACVPVVFGLGRRVAGRRAALMSCTLLALSPPLVRYAQEGRSYSLLVLLVLASWLAAIQSTEGSSSYRWFVVLASLSVYAHVIGLLTVVAEVFWITLVAGRRRAITVAVSIAVIVSPQLYFVLRPEAHGPDWIEPLSTEQISTAISFTTGTTTRLSMCIVLLAWVAGGFVAVHAAKSEREGFLAPLVWLMVAIIGLAVLSVVQPLFIPRNLLPAVPPACSSPRSGAAD